MRTLRLSLAGAVVLILVGSPAAGAAAASEHDGPVLVELLTEEDCRIDGRAAEYTEGVGLAKTVRVLPLSCMVTFDDARLDGRRHVEYNEDCYESGVCVGWGPVEILGSDGSWAGWWNAIDDEVDNISMYNVLTGSGAHEGLTLILYSLGVWGQVLDEYGVIYQGEPPPGPAQILSAE